MSLRATRCVFSCGSQASHLAVLFVYRHISTRDLEAISVVLSGKALVKNSETKNRFFSPFFFFLTSFLLSLGYLYTVLQGIRFRENRSPVLDEVDRNVFFFFFFPQHFADSQRHAFIVSPSADPVFEALAAAWHKSCVIWRCRDEQSGVRPQKRSRVPRPQTAAGEGRWSPVWFAFRDVHKCKGALRVVEMLELGGVNQVSKGFTSSHSLDAL